MQPANSAPLKALDLYLRTRLEDIPLDRMNPNQLDQMALKLVRRTIRQTSRKYRWKLVQPAFMLRDESYSKLVIAKANQLEHKGTASILFFAVLCLGIHRWELEFVMTLLVISVIISWVRYSSSKLSAADNKLVIEELIGRLGEKITDEDIPEEHPLLENWNRRLEKRALLWQVDRFLSRTSKIK
jgi:hypothetical protein